MRAVLSRSISVVEMLEVTSGKFLEAVRARARRHFERAQCGADCFIKRRHASRKSSLVSISASDRFGERAALQAGRGAEASPREEFDYIEIFIYHWSGAPAAPAL
jgi:hypothetical protein